MIVKQTWKPGWKSNWQISTADVHGRRSNYDKVGRTPQILNEKFDDFKHKTSCHVKFIMENVFY